MAKEITKKDIQNVVSELKEEICKVLWVKEKCFAISFKDYGITIDCDELINKDNIIVKYEGEIGKPEFKIVSYEQF